MQTISSVLGITTEDYLSRMKAAHRELANILIAADTKVDAAKEMRKWLRDGDEITQLVRHLMLLIKLEELCIDMKYAELERHVKTTAQST